MKLSINIWSSIIDMLIPSCVSQHLVNQVICVEILSQYPEVIWFSMVSFFILHYFMQICLKNGLIKIYGFKKISDMTKWLWMHACF